MRKHVVVTAGMALVFGIVGVAYAGGDAGAGKAKAGACAVCHGTKGEGTVPNTALAGKGEQRLLQALKDYRSGKRTNSQMNSFAAPLNDREMADLAAYYSSLKGK